MPLQFTVGSQRLDNDTVDALAAAHAPNTSNPFATLADVSGAALPQDILDALNGANAPDDTNVFATMADVGGGSGPLEYLIQWNQNASDAPVVITLIDTIPGTKTITRDGTGDFLITCSLPSFVIDKTVTEIVVGNLSMPHHMRGGRKSDTEVEIYQLQQNALAGTPWVSYVLFDNWPSNHTTFIRVLVYP